MNNVYKNISELVGKTPLLELINIENEYNIKTKIFAKLEYLNPAGSVKDRVAKAMLDEAKEKGLIDSDSVIIEATSGNTGIGLAAIGASRGYKVIIVMPDTMSKERIQLVKAYGAEVVLTDGSLGMNGAINKANELKEQIPNSFIPGQFDNFVCPKAHYETTGKEIYEDTNGLVDIFVCGVGTGGTITGAGKYLKDKNKDVRVIAVEPTLSPVLSKGVSGVHKLQGIGAGFIPNILDTNIYDEIVSIDDDEAYRMCNIISRKEGILVGISSGAAVAATIKISKRLENEGKNIVVLLPDTGERYLSSNLFDN